MPADLNELQTRLWGVADQLRANSGRFSEYSTPVLRSANRPSAYCKKIRPQRDRLVRHPPMRLIGMLEAQPVGELLGRVSGSSMLNVHRGRRS